MQAMEVAQFGRAEFVPRSLDQLVRLLNNIRKNNRVYLKVLAARPGLFLKGEELSNLPPTVKALLSSPRAATSRAQSTALSTLAEYQLAVPVVFRGQARIPLTIKK